MAFIELFFRGSSDSQIQLVEVSFTRTPNDAALRTIRGKFCYLSSAHGSFQWTKAVQALTLLLIKSKIFGSDHELASLSGEVGSFAASLDYAMSKEPAWLSEMFGTDKDGDLFARRLMRRTNPERKRAGPVVISINSHVLVPSSIRIYLDGAEVSGTESLMRILHSFDATRLENSLASSNNALDDSVPSASFDNFIDQGISIVEHCSYAQKLKYERLADGVQFLFESLADAEQSLPLLLDLCTSKASSKGGMLWYLKHSWWPLIRPLYSYQQTEVSNTSGVPIAYASPSNGSPDRWVSSFYSRAGIKSKLGVKPLPYDDLWVFGDIIIEQEHPKELSEEIDTFFKKAEPFEAFDSVSFIRNFLEARGDFKIRIRQTEEASLVKQDIEKALRW
jgi:hypothetical protein